MRITRWMAVGCCIIGLAVPVSAGTHDAELMKEVAAIGDALADAMVDGDTELMLSMYADDAISLPNYGPRMQGVEAFRKHHEEMTAAGMKILSFESSPTEVWSCGDQVTEIGTYRIELSPPGMPDPISDHGSYLTIYERDPEGELRIKVETWNTDLTPMEIAAGSEHGDHPIHSVHDSQGAHGD